ncbi:Transcriptional regulator of ribosomal biogenesis proteins, partial [Entomortierella beljakovae]
MPSISTTTPSINITPTQTTNSSNSPASSFGTSPLRRSSMVTSGSFLSSQLRRQSVFASLSYNQSPQFSDLSNNSSALFDTYGLSSNTGDVYERDLEVNYCKNFSCCGLVLGDLHALLQHYEEAHVRFEEDEDEDDLLGITGYMDDDDWSSQSESVPGSPQSSHMNNTYRSANAAAAATAATLMASLGKSSHLASVGTKKRFNGVSLSDIYSEDTSFNSDESISAFPDSILKSVVAQVQANNQSCKKRDLSTFSSSFDAQCPLSKKVFNNNNNNNNSSNNSDLFNNISNNNSLKMFSNNMTTTAASIIGEIHLSSKTNPIDSNSPISRDEIMTSVTGYLEQAIQRGLLPKCGEIGSPSYLHAVEELLRKREDIVNMMESIGKPGVVGADKPYRCTVVGCDKAYKNPNGLKYHNQHGHSTMTGSTDDEKACSKPYRCTFLDCGKCYKNLNGLKYHIEHSHPNLAAALYANIPGLADLEGGNASQAAITAAAAIAAVKGDTVMM